MKKSIYGCDLVCVLMNFILEKALFSRHTRIFLAAVFRHCCIYNMDYAGKSTQWNFRQNTCLHQISQTTFYYRCTYQKTEYFKGKLFITTAPMALIRLCTMSGH